MKKTIQERLAEKIYELLPEKLELTFGCNTSEGIFLKQDKNKGYFFTEDSLTVVPKTEFKILGIKGQPIRLADVLRVVEKVDNNKNYNNLVKYPYFQNFMMYLATKQKSGFYNLSQDNILNQSNEFCEFIYNLIK